MPMRPAKQRRPSGLALVVVLASAAVALSGCLTFRQAMRVAGNDTVSGSVVVGRTLPPAAASAAPQIPVPGGTTASSSAAALPAPAITAATITRAPYDDGRVTGYKYRYDHASFADCAGFAPLGDRGGALRLRRDDDVVTLSAVYDLRYSGGTDAQRDVLAKSFNGTVAFTFPGRVLSANGSIEGDTITWTLTALARNTLTARVQYARDGAPATGNVLTRTMWGLPLWVLGVLVVVGLLLLLVAASLFRRRADSDQELQDEAARDWGLIDDRPVPSARTHDPPEESPAVGGPAVVAPQGGPESAHPVPSESGRRAPTTYPSGPAPLFVEPPRFGVLTRQTLVPSESAPAATDTTQPRLRVLPPPVPEPASEHGTAPGVVGGPRPGGGWPPPQPRWVVPGDS